MSNKERIDNIQRELASTPNELTKQAIILEYCLEQNIKPSPFKTKNEIKQLKKHHRHIYDHLKLEYPELFEV